VALPLLNNEIASTNAATAPLRVLKFMRHPCPGPVVTYTIIVLQSA
jgi:hypothetical protein